MIDHLEVGTCWINQHLKIVPETPWGGCGIRLDKENSIWSRNIHSTSISGWNSAKNPYLLGESDRPGIRRLYLFRHRAAGSGEMFHTANLRAVSAWIRPETSAGNRADRRLPKRLSVRFRNLVHLTRRSIFLVFRSLRKAQAAAMSRNSQIHLHDIPYTLEMIDHRIRWIYRAPAALVTFLNARRYAEALDIIRMVPCRTPRAPQRRMAVFLTPPAPILPRP